jgi:hypothetical protein
MWPILAQHCTIILQDEEGFLDDLDDESSGALGMEELFSNDRVLDFIPSVEGTFAPTVREPWRSERELKRVRGRSNKGGRKKSGRRQ